MPAALTAAPFPPQLAQPSNTPPTGEEWVHELKWDGYRITTTLVAGKAWLWSRNGLPWTSKAPAIARAIEALGIAEAAMDGELIAGGGTRADFGLLPAALSGRAAAPLTLVLFDLLHLEGYSLENCPLRVRKTLLERVLGARPAGLALSTHVDASGADVVFELAREGGFEGVVSKRLDRPYVHGRSDDWLKIKAQATEEFAVVGYTRSGSARSGFSSLLLARRAGGEWVYAGRVGSGFSDSQARSLMPLLSGGQPSPTVTGAIDRASLRNAVWFEPRLVVEIYTRGTGRSGVLRQPSFKGVRSDRTVAEL